MTATTRMTRMKRRPAAPHRRSLVSVAAIGRALRLCCIGTLFVTGGLLCRTAQAAVTASAERTQLAAGEAVRLTLQSDHGGNSQPDLSALAKDFEIVGRRSTEPAQPNRSASASVRELRLTLAPKRSGRVEVPRLAWDGEQSAAIELVIAANGTAAPASDAGSSVAHVFITTTLDTLPTYVQSAVALQVRLYSDKNIYQANLELPSHSDALVRRIGTDVTSQERRNGRTYQVIARNYLLEPQRSGSITLDGPILNAQVADGNHSARLSGQADPFADPSFGRLPTEGGLLGTRALRLQGDAIRLTAQPRPAGIDSSGWLPAQQLTLEDSAAAARRGVTTEAGAASATRTIGVGVGVGVGIGIGIGQPLTRQLRITAVGLSASQLPDLSAALLLPPGVQAHAGPPMLDDTSEGGHITGIRTQDIAFVADRAGHHLLPALRVAWWDAENKRSREAVLDAIDFEVVAAAASAPPAATLAAAAATSAATSAATAATTAAAVNPTTTRVAASASTAGAQPIGTASIDLAPDARSPLPLPLALPLPLPLPMAMALASPWFWTSLAVAALWLGTAGGWAWSHRRRRWAGGRAATATATATRRSKSAASVATTSAARETAARRQFQNACQRHAAIDARGALLDWAHAAMANPPNGLNALARRLARPAATPLLHALDRACFEGTAWHGDALARALTALGNPIDIAAQAPASETPSATAADQLPQLYSEPHRH